jgi:hypothetical protein
MYDKILEYDGLVLLLVLQGGIAQGDPCTMTAL